MSNIDAVRTFEQILEQDYHITLEDNRRDESMSLAAEKYAQQFKANDNTKDLLSDIISWEKDLSEYNSLESILRERYKITKR